LTSDADYLREESHRLGIDHLHFPLPPLSSGRLTREVEGVVLGAARELYGVGPSYRSLFVHCDGGVHRTGLVLFTLAALESLGTWGQVEKTLGREACVERTLEGLGPRQRPAFLSWVSGRGAGPLARLYEAATSGPGSAEAGSAWPLETR